MIEADRPVASPSLTVLGGLIILLAGLLAYEPSGGSLAASLSTSGVAQGLPSVTGLATGPILALLGSLVYWRPRYRVVWGTLIVPSSLLGFYVGFLGFLVGPVFALIGGVLALAFESRSDEEARHETQGAVGIVRRHYWIVPLTFAAVGILLAAYAPLPPGGACPPISQTCPQGHNCTAPAIAVSCGGVSLWLWLLISAVILSPFAFRLRSMDFALPLPN